MTPSINDRLDVLTQPVVQTFNWDQSAKLRGHQVTIETPQSCHQKCYIIPPNVTEKVYNHRLTLNQDEINDLVAKHKKYTQRFREDRNSPSFLFDHFGFHYGEDDQNQGVVKQFAPVTIQAYNANHKGKLPGIFVARNGPTPGTYADNKNKLLEHVEEFAAQAIDNASVVFEFFLSKFKRNSLDGHNMPILSSVHYGKSYENAFWNGKEMVYGDGSEYFAPFVHFLDVVGHEMKHASTKLAYQAQAGALNEHISDVFGALTYQYQHNQTAEQANWLIGWSDKIEGIILDEGKTYPIRSMEHPGTAYDTPVLGKDPQPDNFHDLKTGKEDDGEVHTNSGIPNRAFALAAKQVGGFAWEKVGLVWYMTSEAINSRGPNGKVLYTQNATMPEFAEATLVVAKKLFPQDPKVYEAILTGWRTVGVLDGK